MNLQVRLHRRSERCTLTRMAWLHDLRDSVQEILEWVSAETPCTCLTRTDTIDGHRCMAHRAHIALGGLYRYGVPTRRFPRALTPRYLPAHRVLVAHDWSWRNLGHTGARERVHNPARCRIWCGDCGSVAPGGCRGREVVRGEVLYWWGDHGWSDTYGRGLEEPRSCTELIARMFELRPAPPAELPQHLLPTFDPLQNEWDLTDDVGTRPPPLRRVGFGSGSDLAGSPREDGGLPPGEYRRPS